MDPLPPAPEAEASWPRAPLAIASAAVLLWRLVAQSPGRLWRDWALILALYGIFLCFRPGPRVRSATASAVMAFLLGLYVQGQWPHLLALLRTSP